MKYIAIAILTILIVGAMQAFRNKKGYVQTNNNDLLEAGQLLFSEFKPDFEVFLNLFLNDKKIFLADNQ